MVVNYTPLGAVFVDGELIGSGGVLSNDSKHFIYAPSISEIEYCHRFVFNDSLPRGRLWEAFGSIGTSDYALGSAVGDMVAQVFAYNEYLRAELSIETTSDLISEWEESCGLPDICSIQQFLTLEERRQRVILHLKKTPIVTAAQIQAMVKTLTGYNILVIPRRYDLSLSGGLDALKLDFELSNDKWDRFVFDVIVDYESSSGLDVLIGESLDATQFPKIIECVIDRLKPANSLAIYKYSSILYNDLLA